MEDSMSGDKTKHTGAESINNADELMRKRCPHCEQYKPVADFYDVPVNYDGLSWWCVRCYKEHDPVYRAEHADHVRERQKLYRADPEAMARERERQRQYRQQHPEQIRQYQQAFRESHRAERAEQQRKYCSDPAVREHYRQSAEQYRAQHADEIRERARVYRSDPAVQERERAWRIAHADELREKRRQYRNDHAEQIKAQKRLAYARKKAQTQEQEIADSPAPNSADDQT
jgi:hypothetical protein